MCKICEDLCWQIAAVRALSRELTDPSSIVLNKADIKALEENLTKAIANTILTQSRLATSLSHLRILGSTATSLLRDMLGFAGLRH